ncbi:RHS repeat-associated core domain-containing protein [Pseudomonas sp. C1C7]|uniref:RHS repeat-associated core domain-containing protein n=1 Tax=Pseudomonas sp. C1C7 TaxID=2735272 RepID=UPI001585DB0F|nr:RHS repeat-associated core domain-containing protein [Pseudomonas sp. C1C7]NUT76729.1 RHS repeat-associated core domain-containing protein [Pseudomonas sp. C1C7]
MTLRLCSHPDYQGLKTDFTYDADGNQQQDELGRQLSYDSQGRLLSVKTPAGQSLTAYRYDPHNHLQSVKAEGETQTLRFYQGTRVSDTLKDDRHVQVLYHRGQPLGQQTPADNDETLLLLTDGKGSVLAENQGSDVRSTVYTPYGERSDDTQLRSLLAFNGEVAEKTTGWYLLGNGYRAYNPSLRRFHTPDSMSPFGPGGLNWYMYCSGNPIAFTDPTGHQRQGRIIDNMAFNFAVGGAISGATIFLGIVASIFTFNPAPLISALKVVGIQATAQAINMAVNVVTWGATILSGGIEVARMFVKDENWNEALGWTAMGIDLIVLPNVAIPTAPSPNWTLKQRVPPEMPKGRVWRDMFSVPAGERPNISKATRVKAAEHAKDLAKVESIEMPSFSRMATLETIPEVNPSQGISGVMPGPQTVADVPQMPQPLSSAIHESPSLSKRDQLLQRDTDALQKNIVLDGQEWNHFRQGWHKPGALGT